MKFYFIFRYFYIKMLNYYDTRCGREMVTQNHYRTERQTDSNEYTADMSRKYASNHVLNFFQKIFHNCNFLYGKYLRVMNR